MDAAFINYLLSIIIYEKKTRTETHYLKHRANDCFQHSHFIDFQQ